MINRLKIGFCYLISYWHAFCYVLGMKNKHILYRRWAIAVIALMVSGCLSPIGMRLLDYFEIKAPLSDIILSVILILIACVVYRLILKYRLRVTNEANCEY